MDYQVAIIGGGPAGYTAAEAAARAGFSVVLFEKRALGGVCLNEGCIPTKTLLYSAKVLDTARGAQKYAVSVTGTSFDLPKIIARKQKVVRKLVLGIKSRLTAGGVHIVAGEAAVVDQHHVQCDGQVYECDKLLLCTGSETFIPPIPGVDTVPYWTHRDALECKTLPHSLVVVGGGVIGMEFAAFFCSLGVPVTVVEMMDEILGGMDRELAALLRAEYAKRGVRFLTSTRVVSMEGDATGVRVAVENFDADYIIDMHESLHSWTEQDTTSTSLGDTLIFKNEALFMDDLIYYYNEVYREAGETEFTSNPASTKGSFNYYFSNRYPEKAVFTIETNRGYVSGSNTVALSVRKRQQLGILDALFDIVWERTDTSDVLGY